jgi:hypothetical protein
MKKIKPLHEWKGNLDYVTITYNAPLKTYLMCIADGGKICAKINYTLDWNGEKIEVNPPETHYGMVLQKIELLPPMDATEKQFRLF